MSMRTVSGLARDGVSGSPARHWWRADSTRANEALAAAEAASSSCRPACRGGKRALSTLTQLDASGGSQKPAGAGNTSFALHSALAAVLMARLASSSVSDVACSCSIDSFLVSVCSCNALSTAEMGYQYVWRQGRVNRMTKSVQLPVSVCRAWRTLQSIKSGCRAALFT